MNEDWSLEELLAVKHAQEQELLKRIHADPVKFFRWHDQQSWWLFEAPNLVSGPVRVMILLGGNRAGKSAAGKGLIGDVLRRQSPLNSQLVTTHQITGEVMPKGPTDPIRIWVVPPTGEKARSDWADPADGLGIKYWMGDLFKEEKKSPDHVFYSNLNDQVWLKSQDQKIETFESSEVDIAIVDEEIQDEAKINSILMRLATSNGILAMTFTPLHGLSWSWRRWYRPLVEEGRADPMGERRWIYRPRKGANVIIVQVGMRDNPKARVYADEVEADVEMSEAEKAARLYGQYGFVEGALLPKLAGLDLYHPRDDQRIYCVERLPGEIYQDRHGERVTAPGGISAWYLVADPNKSYGALLSCTDYDGNIFFVRSHLKVAWSDMQHVEAFKEMEGSYVRDATLFRYADPGSAGAHSMVNLSKLGLPFLPVDKPAGSVSASIKRLRGMTYIDPEHIHPLTGKPGAPRLYFFRPGLLEETYVEGKKLVNSPLCEQLSLARQSDKETDPPDTPHKDIRNKLDLFDCARYTALVALSRADPGRQKIKVAHALDRLEPDSLRDMTEQPLHEMPYFSPTYGDMI
jgi:phage terminase large subunit-like protein